MNPANPLLSSFPSMFYMSALAPPLLIIICTPSLGDESLASNDGLKTGGSSEDLRVPRVLNY